MVEKTIGLRSVKAEPNKTAKLNIRMTQDDLLLLVRAAEALDIQPAEFARRALRTASEAAVKGLRPPRGKKD